jgi:hypothetical protein
MGLSDLNMSSPSNAASGHGLDDLSSTLSAEELRAQLQSARDISSSSAPAMKHPRLNALLGILAGVVDPAAGEAFKAGSEARMAPAVQQHTAAVEGANKYIEQREKLGANMRMLLQSQPHLFEGVSPDVLGELAEPGAGIPIDASAKARLDRMSDDKRTRIATLTDSFNAAKSQDNPQGMKFWGEKLLAESFTPEEMKEMGPGLDMFYASGDVDPQWLMENFTNGVGGYQFFLQNGYNDVTTWGRKLTADEINKSRRAGDDPDKLLASSALDKLSDAEQAERLAHPGVEPNMEALKTQVLSLKEIATMEKAYPQTRADIGLKDVIRQNNEVKRRFRMVNQMADIKAIKDPKLQVQALDSSIKESQRIRDDSQKLDFWGQVGLQQRLLGEQYPDRYPETPEGDAALRHHAILQAIKAKGVAIPQQYQNLRKEAEAFNPSTGR